MEAARPYVLTQAPPSQPPRSQTFPSQSPRSQTFPNQSPRSQAPPSLSPRPQTFPSQPPLTQSTPSSTTAELSSRKSPKKSAKFRQNNSSPKISINEPSTSNRYSQNGPVYSPMRSQNDQISIPMRSQNVPPFASMRSSTEPSTSTRPHESPFPRRPNDVLISAIENHLNKPTPKTSQENVAALTVPSVDSLIITVHNNASTPQRIVQNDATHSVKVESDGTVLRPHQFRFPQSRPFQYDVTPQKRAQKKSVQPVRIQKNIDHINGESSHQRPTWRDYRDRQRQKNYEDEYDIYKKVIVTGFPVYTKPDELVRKLSDLGSPQIEIIKNRVAVILFGTEEEAYTALQANNTITVYGTILSIVKYTNRRHVMELIRENKRVVRNEHKGAPVAVPSEIDLSGDFDQQMQSIEDAIRLTQEEVHNINLLFEDVEKYMRMIFPNCEAVPFGSITTGLGIKSSDADCFLALSPGVGSTPGAGAGALCSQFVSRAARLLRLHPNVFSRLLAIPRANTPIIKFLHVPTNVNCDLNSKTPLGVQNSRLLGHLLRCNPRFGSVALLLKYWARVQQLSGTGRLTNYALLLLLVFYLQRSLLPPVYTLQGLAHSFVVEDWEAGFDRSPLPLVRDAPPARDLLGGFFLYYAGFDFNQLVVCPLVGRPIRKAEFECNVLPPQYELYQRNIRAGLALPVRTSCCLCIQDPFELSHNVASAVSARLAAEIRAHIKLAATAYTEPEKSPGDFMRSILFSRPPAEPSERGQRVSLSARLLLDLDDNWQHVVRDTVLNVMFKEFLFVELTRRDSVSREPDVEMEVYHGTLKRPIWKRGFNQNGRGAGAADMLAWHKDTVARIVHDCAGLPDVHVPFEVEFGFRSKPRGFYINCTSLDRPDDESFRSFRVFVNTFIHRWHKDLLKPHLKKDPTRTEPVRNEKGANTPKKSPKKTTPKRQPKVKSTESVNTTSSGSAVSDLPIASVAFVNSYHKSLCESVSAISLNDNSKNSKCDSDYSS